MIFLATLTSSILYYSTLGKFIAIKDLSYGSSGNGNHKKCDMSDFPRFSLRIHTLSHEKSIYDNKFYILQVWIILSYLKFNLLFDDESGACLEGYNQCISRMVMTELHLRFTDRSMSGLKSMSLIVKFTEYGQKQPTPGMNYNATIILLISDSHPHNTGTRNQRIWWSYFHSSMLIYYSHIPAIHNLCLCSET